MVAVAVLDMERVSAQYPVISRRYCTVPAAEFGFGFINRNVPLPTLVHGAAVEAFLPLVLQRG